MSKQSVTLIRHAARLNDAKREGREARAALARESKPGRQPNLIDPSMAWAAFLLEDRRKSLMQIPGVIGVSLGFRMSEGVMTQEPCATVAVSRKLSETALRKRGLRRVPKILRVRGKTLAVDVLELGKVRTQADVGDDIGPQTKKSIGTLGSLAVDDATGATVAITAMHVSGRQRIPTTSTSSIAFCRPSRYTQGNPLVFA
ncbi:MAG TPA: hypothetical protein VM536_23285, partial [Chloroflexia bacterium]|nr:hypothetical protein [Chloroflexia bacterium]